MKNHPTSGQRTIFVQYTALFALFLNIIWQSWSQMDLTSGDTSSYYITARQFARHLTCNIAWSPIYTSLLGSFGWINPDPYFATLGHRILILAVIAVLIFEIARRIMNSWIAWFITAWWLCLPINFHSLYEVHLFAFIPILIFWLILACRQTVGARGWALGLLLASTFLVRNEFLIPLSIFALVSAGYDIRNPVREQNRVQWGKYIKAYGIPLLVALVLIGTAYWRSTVKFPELKSAFREKHTLNVSQIYAFGYGQRHPEYQASPWTDYHSLMKSEFGGDDISMGEAFAKNPKAMISHFLWNIRLIPSGIQVALFNMRSGDVNPDYAPSKLNRPVALILSLSALSIFIWAFYLILKSPDPAKRWIKQNRWLVVGLLSVCVAVAIVMVMQRPRPSYMFTFTFTIMLSLGLALHLILNRFKKLPALGTLPVYLAVMLIIFCPTMRDERSTPLTKIGRVVFNGQPPANHRPLLSYYRLLSPYAKDLGALNAKAAIPGYTSELNSYLGFGHDDPEQRFVPLDPLLSKLDDTDTLQQKFSALNVHYALFRRDQLSLRPVRDFISKSNDWVKIETQNPNIVLLVKK